METLLTPTRFYCTGLFLSARAPWGEAVAAVISDDQTFETSVRSFIREAVEKLGRKFELKLVASADLKAKADLIARDSGFRLSESTVIAHPFHVWLRPEDGRIIVAPCDDCRVNANAVTVTGLALVGE